MKYLSIIVFCLVTISGFSQITGPTQVCDGASNITYYSQVTGFGKYRWALNGNSIVSGDDPRRGAPTVAVYFPADATITHTITLQFIPDDGGVIQNWSLNINEINPGTLSISQSTVCRDIGSVQITQSGLVAPNPVLQKSVEGGAWTDISGAVLPFTDYTISGNSAYRIKVSSSCGFIYSNTVNVNVYSDLQGGSINGNQTICYNTVPATLSNAGLAYNNLAPYTYQWQFFNGGSWVNIAGATGQDYSPGALTSTVIYRRLAISACSVNAASNTITVTVYPPLSAGSISNSSATICSGSSAPTFSSAAASGGNSSYTYEWQQSANNVNWYTAPGANTGATYTPPVQSNIAYYRRRVVSCGQEAYSNSVSIGVYSALSAGTISNSVTSICSGSAATTFTSYANASGSNGSYAYQWEQSLDNYNWSNASGSNTSVTYSPPAQTATTYYRRRVSACNETVYSNTVSISVYAQVTGGTIANATLNICPATSPAAFTSTVNAAQGNGSYSYQWEQSADNVNWSNASGSSTAATYSAPSLSNTTYYRRRVLSCGVYAYSNTITIQVYSALQPGAVAHTTPTVCSGTAPASITSSADASGSNGSYSYLWQQSTDNVNWAIASGSNAGTSYAPPALTSAMYYRRSVSACGQTVYSNTITVNIYAALNAGSIQSASSAICAGSTPGTITSYIDPTGGSGSYTYLWLQSSDGTNYSSAAGVNTNMTYTPPALSTSMYYKRRVSSCGVEVTSHPQEIAVDPVSVGGTIAGGQEAYGIASGSLTLTGYTGTIQKWQQKIGSGSWTDVGNTTTSQSYTNVNNTTYYRAVVKSGECAAANSAEAAITIHAVPSLSINGPSAIAPGGSTQLVATSGLYSYTWYKNNLSINGATTNTLTVTQPGIYKVIVKTTSTSPEYATGDLDIDGTLNNPIVDMNYIRSTTFNVPLAEDQIDVYQLEASEFTLTTTYFDGLGRPVQSVSLGAAGNGADLIQPVEYDAYGREVKKYLPYAHTSADGRYQPTAFADQLNFYSNASTVAHDVAPFSVTVLENSPLSRMIKQGAPGLDWQPDSDSTFDSPDHTIKYDNDFNTSGEVWLWSVVQPVQDTSFAGISAGTGDAYYAANQLYKNKMRDEQQRIVIQYTDKNGRMLLKRVQATDNKTEINNTDYASTYYIYDDRGNLTCVLPPEATKRLNAEFFNAQADAKEAFLKRWAYRYRYDGRKRLMMKKVPGAEPVYMVYDNRDRLVLTQDGNQRTQNQWSFTKYDALNRPVVTGLYAHTSLQTQQQMSGNISTTAFTETFSTAQPHGYTTTNVFPSANLTVHTVTFYDNYDFSTLAGAAYNFDDDHLTGQRDTEFDRLRGQVTATKVNILNSADYLWTVTYYDDKYRPIQVVMQNHVGGTVRTTNKYDFVKLVQTKTTTTTSTTAVSTQRSLVYDAAGRLTETWHKVNAQDSVLLVKNEYNALGQLIDKKLHSEDNGSSFAQSVDYTYNIRGWLSAINDAALTLQSNEAKDYFGFELNYNTVDASLGNSALFNGNISATRWSENMGYSTVKQRAYVYEYDTLYRLRNAHVKEKAVSWLSPANNAFKEGGLQYDLNGNIEKLQRHDATATLLDNLTYSYAGNQLQKVDDSGNDSAGFKDGSTATTEYTYDANGNMTSDANKKIVSISYNTLNLPREVLHESGDRIVYHYTATGQKLKQEVDTVGTASPEKITDYAGELIIENDTVKIIQHEEGRISLSFGEGQGEVAGGKAMYQYHLKDHLGNVRITFNAQAQTVTATMETANETEEVAQFLKYDDVRKVNAVLFDHTPGGSTHYAVRLTGSSSETYGLAKSLQVAPGDKVSAEVYAKYIDPNASNWTSTLNDLLAAIANGTTAPGTVIDGGAYGSTGGSTIPYSGLLSKSNDNGTGPKAYLNWIVFDANFNPIAAKSGFRRMTDVAKESGNMVPHERLEMPEIEIEEHGFVYIYFSMEETGKEVYFDDFAVEHLEAIVQTADYYPFGLTFNNYSRENSVKNNYLYNGKEQQHDLDLGWYDYQARQYDPMLGRFTSVDPAAELMRRVSPYAYAFNNPVRFTDPDGMVPQDKIMKDYQEQWARIDANGGFSKSFSSLGDGGVVNATANKSNATTGGDKKKDEKGSTDATTTSTTTTTSTSETDPDKKGGEQQQTQGGAMILDIDGNIVRSDQGASLIYIDTGNGMTIFRNQLVKDGTMTPKAFSNALLSVVNGMKLPNGTFDKNRLHNGEISLAITGLDGKVISYNGGRQAGAQAHYMDGKNGSFMITYQHFDNSSLTVQGIQSRLGIHEYYAHGVEGLRHWRPGDNEKIDKLVAGYPY